MAENGNGGRADPYHLGRFVRAQEAVYGEVLAELGAGRKQTHWMWFVFPQIEGLGHSDTTRYYAIKSGEEAQAYLQHPLLGERLLACCEALLAISGRSAQEILGHPDDRKLKSSMTLFSQVAGPDSVFARVLERYFQGEQDMRTLKILGIRG